MVPGRPPVLLGRAGERQRFDQLLEDLHSGRSAVLVVRGEAGVGKTALLRYCAQQAAGVRVARVAGVEAEMELAFAALHQLCAPLLARVDDLPPPQRDALCVALGLASGDRPDRFLVGLAVLGLLSAAAEERPLLCLVDDAQWLDAASGQVLGFVGRRLGVESVGIAVGLRELRAARDFHGLPELPLAGLAEEPARALLARTVPGRLDDRVRDRIVAETRGNPLALLELPRTMSAAELAAGFEPAPAADQPGQIEDVYLRRIRSLPDAARQLLLLAAADPLGDATLVWRAGERLGIGTGALGPAQDADLLDIGAQVRFRHPLVRSAAYRAASAPDRQRAHAALALVSDLAADADHRAWHRALAAVGPDEDIAAELEDSAGRAQTRGGLAAAAAFLERAAALSGDPAGRARRALAAARAKHQAGAPAVALALLASAQAGPLDELQRAQAQVLRAEIAFSTNHGSDAPPLLLDAARRLEPLDVGLARETYLDALTAAQFAGRLAPGAVWLVAEAARAAPPALVPHPADLLLDGLAGMITDGHAAAAPVLRQAVHAFRTGDVAATGGFRWLWLAEEAAQELWDHDAWLELSARHVQLVRDAGALAVLPLALSAIVVAQVYAGDLAAAAASIDEMTIAIEATGTPLAPYAALTLAAWQGRAADLTALVATTLADIVPRGEGIGVSCCQWLTALLHNGLASTSGPWRRRGRRSSRPGGWTGRSRWRCRSWWRPPSAAVRRRRPARRSSDWRRSVLRAGPTGGSGSRSAAGRCWAGPPTPSRSTGRRSSGSAAPGSAASTRERTCSMGSGCVGRAGGWTRASSYGRRTGCSPAWRWGRSPSAPDASWWPPGRPCAGARSASATS